MKILCNLAVPAGGTADERDGDVGAGPLLGVGIYDCPYWLHTHSYDGIIQIESSRKQLFTLAQFFDAWAQKRGPLRVGPTTGEVVSFDHGKRFTGDPTSVSLPAR